LSLENHGKLVVVGFPSLSLVLFNESRQCKRDKEREKGRGQEKRRQESIFVFHAIHRTISMITDESFLYFFG
jgi:hypothetical protein